ncbi:hypothetical protein METHB2_1250001 [Candidatus Methylobacter favarea]|uniref:Uncharacterized protein n=1 Tax=Candidatus Methylobacter favarea TaxID=2707345 RepID=A0A8S0Y972_9GAMM|nr:hypothetical protein METHB2_1250001 [Candidatus Methylobacter favarea]
MTIVVILEVRGLQARLFSNASSYTYTLYIGGHCFKLLKLPHRLITFFLFGLNEPLPRG